MLPNPSPPTLHPGLGDVGGGLTADAVKLHGLGLVALGGIEEERQLVVDAGGQGLPSGVALAQVGRAFQYERTAGVGQHVELKRAAAIETDAVELGDGDFAFEGHLGQRYVGVLEAVAVDGNLKGLETVLALPLWRDGLSDLKAEGGDHAVTGGPVGLRRGGKPQAAGGGSVVPVLEGVGRQRGSRDVARTADQAHELGRIGQFKGQAAQAGRRLTDTDLGFENTAALGIEGRRGEFHPTRC